MMLKLPLIAVCQGYGLISFSETAADESVKTSLYLDV